MRVPLLHDNSSANSSISYSIAAARRLSLVKFTTKDTSPLKHLFRCAAAAMILATAALAQSVNNVNMPDRDNTAAVQVKTEGVKAESISQYQNNFNATSQWVSQFSQADGALLYTPQQIDPYFANIAAIGMTKDRKRRIGTGERGVGYSRPGTDGGVSHRQFLSPGGDRHS